MAQIRDLIDNADEAWAVKDALKQPDPMRMNKTQFVRYLSARVEALVIEARQKGITEPSEINDYVDAVTKPLVHNWRSRAAEINRSRVKHDKRVEQLRQAGEGRG